MFDHCEIRATLGAIQTFPNLRQNEMAGGETLLPNALVDGDHQAGG